MIRKRKKYIFILNGLLLLGFASGCGQRESRDTVKVSCREYQSVTYNTAVATRGDIAPVLDIRLKSEDYEVKMYSPVLDNMEIESVNVAVGDVVEAGTVMVTFKSEDIDEKIKAYRTRLDEDSLLLDHYTRLQDISPDADYSEEIKSVKDDMEICTLYISELEAKIKSYSFVADRNGIVSDVSNMINYEGFTSNDRLITVKYGSGQFTASVADNYEFEIGDVYEATYGMASFETELTNIEEQGTDSDGNPVRKLYFQVKDNTGAISSYDTLNIKINKNVLSDVLYVPKEAVRMVEDVPYAYIVDDRGMRHCVRLTIGDTVDGYTVIKSGLSEGDRVVIN